MADIRADSVQQFSHDSFPLTSFEPFPRLPAELRLKIWSLLESGPRELHIACKKGIASALTPKRYATAFTSSTPPPITTRICTESKVEALEKYDLLFRTSYSDSYIYVCFETDTVSMLDSDLRHVPSEELNRIQKMRLTVADFVYFGHYHMDTITTMKSLKELTIVLDEEAVARERERGHWYPPISMRDFESERKYNPGWECPVVTLVGNISWDILGQIDGGALVPGWKMGDAVPSEDGDEVT